MHPEVDGHQDHVFGKDVRLLRPSAESRLTFLEEFGIEERVEAVERVWLLGSLHQKIHVEVDDLVG